jgi:rod shape-determining protein MreC
MPKIRHNIKKKTDNDGNIYVRAAPLFFIALSLFFIILPLQKPINSVRAVLAYIFIPQLRAVHSLTQYLHGVSESVESLLNVAAENYSLKDEIVRLKIQNAQNEILQRENDRLNDELNLSKQTKWHGRWAKIVYREPSQLNRVIISSGSDHGIALRSPVIGVDGGVVGLIGKVIEVNPKTSQIMLSGDEEFFVTSFLSENRVEGLSCGDGRGGMFVKYITLETPVKNEEKVYTSISSAIFPDGILIGEIALPESSLSAADAFLTLPLKPAVNPMRVKEVFVMSPSVSGNFLSGAQK